MISCRLKEGSVVGLLQQPVLKCSIGVDLGKQTTVGATQPGVNRLPIYRIRWIAKENGYLNAVPYLVD